MKLAAALLVVFPAFSQTTQNALTMATRMSQLMESTAVAVPELIPASESLRRMTASTVASIRDNPRNAAFDYRFISQVAAFLALSDSFPAAQLPPIALQQFGELREDLARFRQMFEASLDAENRNRLAADADPNDLHRYAEDNTKLPPLGTLARIVFLGDSITDGWRLNDYFRGHEFLNRGISGQTSTQMLGRFLQDVISIHPKVVVVLAGTNDIAHGIGPKGIEDNLTMMGDLAKSHGIKLVFGSILPVSEDVAKTRPPAEIRQIDSWLQDYCNREGFIYLDYFKALADGQGHMPPDLSDDGLHPNARGYSVMAPVALDAINRALAPSAPAAAPTQPKHHFGLPVPK
jgi:lysophospholipase L1-like esterase